MLLIEPLEIKTADSAVTVLPIECLSSGIYFAQNNLGTFDIDSDIESGLKFQIFSAVVTFHIYIPEEFLLSRRSHNMCR